GPAFNRLAMLTPFAQPVRRTPGLSRRLRHHDPMADPRLRPDDAGDRSPTSGVAQTGPGVATADAPARVSPHAGDPGRLRWRVITARLRARPALVAAFIYA